MTNTRKTGMLGESIAADYLKSEGFTIIGRNVYVHHKEIDIIAEDDDFCVFFEVKARSLKSDSPSDYGRPSDRINSKKKHDLLIAADVYIKTHGIDKIPRIDVLEIYLEEKDPQKMIFHIRNAVNRLS